MKVAIMQPTYLPWIGYFDLINKVDIFVLFDSVQFEKRSWQQRNRIKGPHGEVMLTVPVITKGRRFQLISVVEINQELCFFDGHLKSIKHAYSKAPYFEQYFDVIQNNYDQRHSLLVDLNIDFITLFCRLLGIETKLIRSSSLPVDGKSSELLVNICNNLNAKEYHSPARSYDYIQDGDIFLKNNIKVKYHQFNHPIYQQRFGSFLSHLSVIDLLFNVGAYSMDVINTGSAPSLSKDQLKRNMELI